ncbi:MAG TPA: hypothetical protein VFG68_07845 [Fimbriiglobus sp.]|nr:hypothetical protein [Fimbriiglobus sp.]
MPIKVTCPKCQGVLHAPDDAGGKRGKCPTCGTVLAIPAEGGSSADLPPPEPFRASEPLPEPAGTHRSSFGAIPRPPDVEPRRPATGSRLPAPPAFAPAEPRKPADPFAKPGKRAVAGIPGQGLVRAWRRARRGLGWVQLALFLFLIGAVGYAGIAVADTLGVKLPSQDPGYLKLEGLSSDTEIRVGVLLIPAVLGVLACTIGRFGVSNAPRSSFAKGLSTVAAVASLIVLLGVVAILVPVGVQVAQGFVPQGFLPPPTGANANQPDVLELAVPMPRQFLPADDPNGMAQRIGMTLAVIFGVMAEVWFVTALGRMGAALHDVRLGSRATRFVVLVGLAIVVVLIGWAAFEIYPRDMNQLVADHVQPQWDKLGDSKPAVVWGLIGLAGLVYWLMYTRMVGAARRAIREWLEQNEPAV